MNLVTSHRFPVNPKTFWEKIYFDSEYNRTLFMEHIHARSYELLEYEKTGSGISRKVRIVPEQKAPSFIQKMMSGEFSYVEEGSFDEKEGVYTFRITPSVKAEKIRVSGRVTAEPEGDGGITRIVYLDLVADIFAVGGHIEKFVGEMIKKGYEKSYQFTLDWIRSHDLK